MWPKLLFDLLPHFARLAPVADKYFNSRTASDKAQEAALAALGEDVRREMGQVSEAQAGFSRQLKEQGQQIATSSVEVARVRLAIESAEARIAKLEKRLGVALKLLVAVLVLAVVAVVLLVMGKR